MKCKCGVKLFDKDVVETDMGTPVSTHFEGKDYIGLSIGTYFKYRCPKCFKTKKVMEE